MNPKCPKCGSEDTTREEVDIGVGTQYGPLHCRACGFDEQQEVQSLFRIPMEDDFNAF
jgi:transcription elongation factor Elf1